MLLLRAAFEARNAMASGLIDDLSDQTRGAQQRPASVHGRSMEAEIRAILETALAPTGIGSALAAFGRRHGGIDVDVPRGAAPGRAADFDRSSSTPAS